MLKYKRPVFWETEWFKLMLISIMILMLFFFGIKGASQDVVRSDEHTTLGHIGALDSPPGSMSLSDTIDSLATYSAQHPPLYFLSANIWGRIFSYHSFMLSLLSVFFGVFALAIFYRLAKDVGGETVAFYTTLLLATSSIFVFYIHDIRQYSLLLLGTGMTWLLYRRLCRQQRELTFMQLGLLTTMTLCTIYTHYTAMFLLIAMGVYHVLFVPKTKAWMQISVAIGIAGVFFVPWIPIMSDGLTGMVSQMTKNQHKIMDNEKLIAYVVNFWSNGQWVFFATLTLLGGVASIFNPKSRYALFFFVTVSAVILGINENFEFIKQVRYVFVLILPFYLLGGFGLALLHRTRLLPLLFIIVWVISGSNFQSDLDYLQQTQLLPIHPYLEYNHLVPLAETTLSSDDLLITASKSGGSMNPGKQGKMSLEDYYLGKLELSFINIRGERGQEDFGTDDLVLIIEDYPSFWITYRDREVSQLVEILDVIAETYASCKVLTYGQNSELEQFVKIQRFEELCSES